MTRRLLAVAAIVSLLLFVGSALLLPWSGGGGTLKTPPRPSVFPIQSQLARPLPQINFSGAGFSDVLDFLRDVSGIPIAVDWTTIEAAGVDRNAPLNLVVSNARLGEVLATLVQQNGGLVFVARDNTIFITTRAALDRDPQTRPATVTRTPATPPPARDPRIREAVLGRNLWTATVDPFGVLHVWRNPIDPASAYQPSPPGVAGAKVPVTSKELGEFGYERQGYPYHSSRVRVPVWALMVVTAILPLLWAVLAVRRRRRKGPGQCPKCGYDLRATPGRCPECGYDAAAAAPPARKEVVVSIAALVAMLVPSGASAAPELIVHNGHIVTADAPFSVRGAMAVEGGKITAVGTDAEVVATRSPTTTVIDLRGRTVLPGLIDSHVHPSSAAMTEFDHAIPAMESMDDVLAYVKARAAALGPGKWVQVSQVFITRLKEQRYPTRQELDAAAPQNPVLFSTGPDASLNTAALRLSGIDRDFKVSDGGPGYAEKDAAGEPTGILRGCTRYVKVEATGKTASEEDRYRRTLELFRDYNAAGLTTVADRNADPDAIARYTKMRDARELTVRMSISHSVATIGSMADIEQRIAAIGKHPLRADDPMLRLIGIKTFLDGGMLTGSAYMLEPWGVSSIYSITDPSYRGVLLIPKERLAQIVRAAAKADLQFTAHSVGDGAVRTLLDAYEQLDRELPAGALRATRPCVTHCNFVHPDDVGRFARLGVVADLQPVWLYLDARTLFAQFGDERLARFQPLAALFAAGATVGGGSDHMQKIGPRRSINPYDPFLGMATAVTRTARWREGPLHAEHALSREQMVRFYTSNNAYLLFKEKQVGSLEPGKFADFIVIDTDVLSCPPEKIGETKVLETYLGGRRVFPG